MGEHNPHHRVTNAEDRALNPSRSLELDRTQMTQHPLVMGWGN